MQIRHRWRALTLLTLGLLFLLSPWLIAYGQTIVFGPEQFVLGIGKPRTVVRNFSVSNPGDEYTLVIQSGDGKSTRVSSAVITLNGIRVLGPNDFNKQVDLIEKPVSLEADNEITVEVMARLMN